MRKGDKVRWAEAHCRLEAMRARNHDAVYSHLREQVGDVINHKRVGERELLTVVFEGLTGEPHVLPAELLERVMP